MPPVEPVGELARTAGLRQMHLPRLEEVDRRRAQLWLLSLLAALAIPAVLVASALGIVSVSLVETLDVRTVQLALLALLVVVMGYVAEREVTLRRLSAVLVDERVLTASLLGRVEDLHHLLRATSAMNSSGELGEVLDVIVTAAHELLRAADAAILLVDPDEDAVLEVVATSGEGGAAMGERVPVDTGAAGTAAQQRDALLVTGAQQRLRMKHPVGSALVVPLEVRGQLLGVLEVHAGEAREPFTEFDLRSLAVFGDAAAAAITNARAHARARRQVADLLERDKAKDEFLTLVTHELRTPLTSVIGLLTTISKRAGALETERVAQYAELGHQQAWRLNRLIDNILRASSAQRSTVRLNPMEHDTAETLRRVVRGIEEAHPQRRFHLALPREPLVAQIDADALAQVADNLVGNAVKYTPPDSPIEVALEGDPHGVTLTVTDHGPGIPDEQREELFAKFVRGPDPQHAGGLGLGLFLVRALAESHGGMVRLEDAPGGGCRFVVRMATAVAGQVREG